MKKLTQVLAVEENVKKRVHDELSENYKIVQKPALFNGFSRVYQPLADDDKEVFPSENQKIQFTVDQILAGFQKSVTDLFDVTVTKDSANCQAKADVVIDGKVVLTQVPATFLLFMEKKIQESFIPLIERLPVLDSAEDWTKDDNSGYYKTGVAATHRNKKVQRPIVLYDATPEHPAQTQLISDDVLVGLWNKTSFSAAIPAPRKQELLNRVKKLYDAVKTAREEANLVEAPDVKVGQAVMDYIFERGNTTALVVG